MRLKKNSILCLLSLLFLFHTITNTTINNTSNTTTQDYGQLTISQHTPETIISIDHKSDRKNVKIFAAQPPQNKIVCTGQEFIAQELLQRYTPETDTWYANGCENNQLLNNLVDTVINYFTKNNLNNKNNAQKIIIFDIDDTILSFYKLYFNKAHHAIKNNTHFSRLPTTKELYDDTFSIRPIFRLYQFFISQGFKIAFVTARSEEYRNLTQEQLKMFGYTTYDHLYLLPTTWNKTQKDQYKEWAREQLAQSYEIIATLDDDWRNLTGKHVGLCAIWVPTLFEQRPGENEYFMSLKNNHTEQQKLL